MIDASSVIKLNEAELGRLSERVYNDTYLMDQNACSSPHLIIWQGAEKEFAKEIFWNAVYHKVSMKYQLEAGSAVEKYTLLCKNAIDLNNIKSFKKYRNYLYRIEINDLIYDIDKYRGKFGHFFEYVNNKYQTMTYFGINKLVLKDLGLENSLLGIDRIVPIGQAMDMGVIWDGYDVVRSLSRVLEVK